MKNQIQYGRTLPLIAPYAVASGAGALVGALFVVAANAVESGAEGEFVAEGAFELTCLNTSTFAQGAKVYWDNTNKRCTHVASTNYLIGSAIAAKVNGPTVVSVRLDGVTTTAES